MITTTGWNLLELLILFIIIIIKVLIFTMAIITIYFIICFIVYQLTGFKLLKKSIELFNKLFK